jgi:methionyl-tRNA formyltransferase
VQIVSTGARALAAGAPDGGVARVYVFALRGLPGKTDNHRSSGSSAGQARRASPGLAQTPAVALGPQAPAASTFPDRLRILFMGTPELACASLQALLNSPSFQVIAAVTQPDRPKGRDLRLMASPVKELALKNGLIVLQPAKARDGQFIESIRQLQPELIAVAAFGQILPPALLEVPRFGCLNVHTSLLPKLRGAAPIQWAILNGDQETGVTIMKMDAGLDTGDMLTQERTPILDDDTAQTLQDRLAKLGADLLVKTIGSYANGKIRLRPQPKEGVSYARKITKSDGEIDWTQSAQQIRNQVRGLIPWPGAFTRLPPPQPDLLKIWSAELCDLSAPPGQLAIVNKTEIVVGCGRQALRLLILQREGGRRLVPGQFLTGRPLAQGERLG